MFDYKDYLDRIDKKAYHAGEFQWEEDGYTVTRTYHYSPTGCHDSCGILCYTDADGKLCKVEGDPMDPCRNGKLCVRCLNNVESVNNPQRLKYPMKRVGERGENKWERISWDEAWEIITEKVHYYWENFGYKSISITHGTGRNVMWQMEYLANVAMKTRNVGGFFFSGWSCYLPRVIGAQGPMGDFAIVDASMGHEDRYLNAEWTNPGVLVVWGNEPLKSNADGYIGHWLLPLIQQGTKIISIDPALTWWGARADVWLQIRPGTDGALAMAFINVMIEEDIYDHDFVKNWCFGFKKLAKHVADATPEWAGEICGLDPEDIRKAARMMCTEKPAAFQCGVAMDQQLSAMPLCGALVDLYALTGCVDVPGGMLLVRDAFGMYRKVALGIELVDEETKAAKLSIADIGVEGADFIDHYICSDAVVQALETEKPYPLKMMWIESSNQLACCGNAAQRTYDALMKVEFIVYADPFLTPTAVAVADIVLPVAMSAERDGIRVWWTPMRAMSKCCRRYYESKTDEEIVVEAALHINPDEAICKTAADLLNLYIAIGGAAKDHHEVAVDMVGYKYCPWDATYYKYEKGMLRADGKPGFETPTGKIELYSLAFESWGLPPLPEHVEPLWGPLSTPELMESDYPIILTTGARSYEFFHSENRIDPTMRELHPLPRILIHPETAKKYGIEDGQWMWVENMDGRFRQIAHYFTGIKPGTISAEHGWWFPEQEGAAPSLFGTFDSNSNNCTRFYETGFNGVGSGMKSAICKIYPYKEGDIMPGVQVTELGGWRKFEPCKP